MRLHASMRRPSRRDGSSVSDGRCTGRGQRAAQGQASKPTPEGRRRGAPTPSPSGRGRLHPGAPIPGPRAGDACTSHPSPPATPAMQASRCRGPDRGQPLGPAVRMYRMRVSGVGCAPPAYLHPVCHVVCVCVLFDTAGPGRSAVSHHAPSPGTGSRGGGDTPPAYPPRAVPCVLSQLVDSAIKLHSTRCKRGSSCRRNRR